MEDSFEFAIRKKYKMVPLLGYELSSEDPVREIPAKIVSNTIARLENSLKYLSLYEFNNAVEAIKNAEVVTLFGMENSYAVASDLAAKLTYIGFKCSIHPDPFMQEVSAKNLSSKDVAIAFSYTGNSISTVRALQNAKAMGATTIAVTSNENANLAKFADILLCFSGKQYLYGNVIFSRTSQLAICDMLYAGVFVSDFDKYKKKLEESSIITDYMMHHE